MNKIVVATLFAFLITNTGYSTDSSSVNFLPLEIGNVFVYTYSFYGAGDTTYPIRVSIDRDTILNNHCYFFCADAPWGTGWFRTDTTTSCVYKYDSTNSCNFYYFERLVDSLVTLSNGWNRCQRSILSSSITPEQLWGYPTKELHISVYVYNYINIYRNYGLNFGLTKYVSQGRYSGEYYTLKGCCINGTVYGDTSIRLVNLSNISIVAPNIFSLSQNYPNPFNPQTKIKFDVPKASFTKLIIYDLLGREIATLVNEELKPGTYEADWDASNFSSGVYFYKIISGDYVETKKMLMVK